MGNDCPMSSISRLRAPARIALSRAIREPAQWPIKVVARFARFFNPILTKRRWAGAEHIPRSGGVIIVANHTSNYDPLLFGEYLVYGAGRWPRFLGKAELWKVPVLGWFVQTCEQIPVFRDTDQAGNSLIAAERALSDKGHCICIYPEGTITDDPDVWPMTGRRGAAQLALSTGVPIIPVATDGAHRVLGTKDIELWRIFGRRKPVSIMARPAFDLSAYEGVEPTKQVLDEVTDLIIDTLTDMVAELRGVEPPTERFDARLGHRVARVRGADE